VGKKKRNWKIIKGEKQKDSRNGSEIEKNGSEVGKKTYARKKGEEGCPGSGGKNIQRGTTIEQKWPFQREERG